MPQDAAAGADVLARLAAVGAALDAGCDGYDPVLLAAVFLFPVLDAGFTLIHLSRGANELNPFMAMLLKRNDALFLSVKLGMAGLGLLFLGIHQHFPYVRRSIRVLFVIFGLLLGYHLLVFTS